MHHVVKRLLNYLHGEFFDALPEILMSEMKSRKIVLINEDNSQRIISLKEAVIGILRKFENDVLQVHIAELKSMLNLAFLTIFYNDFIDPTIEYSYQEKINQSLLEKNRSKLENETRQMILDENLLSPRSIDYQILQKINNTCLEFFSTDTKLVKKLLASFVQTFFSELKWHLKNYALIKTRELRIITFYEFEFLMSMVSFPEQHMNDENYQKIKGVFADLANETIDKQKLFSYYKLKLKTMHIRYHYMFVFRMITATA